MNPSCSNIFFLRHHVLHFLHSDVVSIAELFLPSLPFVLSSLVFPGTLLIPLGVCLKDTEALQLLGAALGSTEHLVRTRLLFYFEIKPVSQVCL